MLEWSVIANRGWRGDVECGVEAPVVASAARWVMEIFWGIGNRLGLMRILYN